MLKSINEFINNEAILNGALYIDPNTGSGKSYNSCRAIYQYSHNSAFPKKIYFTTSLLKNLCVPELKKIYEENENPNFEKEVLIVESNVNFVKHTLPNVRVPENFQSEEYKNLLTLVEEVISPGFANSRNIYREEIEKRLTSSEYAFRKSLRKLIGEKIKGSPDEKKEIIKNDRRFQWIGQIYPTVFFDDYKIYFLSISKLLKRNDTLIRPSYQFISKNILQNSIFFIDEFDATKETIQSAIIEDAISAQNDYLDIVKELHGKLHDYKPAVSFYKPYQDYAQDKPYLHTLDSITKEVDLIYEKYALFFNYKTDGAAIDHKRGFLFFDGSFRSYLRNNCHYIRTSVNEEEQQVKIYFETKEAYNQNKNLKKDINIYSLLREVTNFLNTFARFIANWASIYMEYENSKRKEQYKESSELVIDSFTFEKALDTICDIYFKNDTLNSILHDLVISSSFKNTPEIDSCIEDFSFYNRGYKFFEFIDNDSHNEETKFHFVQLNNTPEKILLFMAKNAKIVCLSATCRIDSVLSNYSINYLKEELKDNIFYLNDESYQTLISEQNRRFESYSNGTIQVEVKSIDESIENKSINDRLALICQNKDLQKIWCNKLRILNLPKNNADYYQKRYCNIFEVLKRFIENDEIKSFLCLNMALPKENNPSFDLNTIQDFVTQYCKVFKKKCPETRVLNSENFDNKKDTLLEDLAN